MDEQFHEWGKVKWLWLAALVVSEAASLITGTRYGGPWITLQMCGGVFLLFLLIFGAYYLWRRSRARQRREVFSAAIQAQSTVAPRSVNDPNQRAALDRLRQKFQAGLNEFTSRGRDIYKLPWYLIIGEPGSGKTEAIRHSGIDFPPGLQNELQGSGGTVNMDWWFTNHGVMLDTAGRLLFSESPAGQSPEWGEFLKLLKKARSHCPINGLFIVLSVESLIKDSAERIAQKASRMAQQLDLIQRTLDVRFPVYLLVSKCDLLTGFRDFFESVDDPLLQHQIFGWSNPDPLDAPFRPDLVDEHLRSVGERIRRRRLWLLRESFARRLGSAHTGFRSSFDVGLTESAHRRAEDAKALFALPESVQRLAPRLRRYLETIFVSGEWSAKPVFLRGIFFTSSMREGKALDEAIAFATGLPLDQLPEDESWEKDRAFFLRDLFLEKVFREAGLVTPATNTLKLLRSHWLGVYGASALASCLLVGFAVWGYWSLDASVRREAEEWKYAAAHWDAWSPELVAAPNEQWQFRYTGDDPVNCRVPFLERKPSLIDFHALLQKHSGHQLPTLWIFRPIARLQARGERDRQPAQQAIFAQWIVKPLIAKTRLKMEQRNLLTADPEAIERHRAALLALIQLEVDGIARRNGRPSTIEAGAPDRYLTAFLPFLAGRALHADPRLLDIMDHTFAANAQNSTWPPEDLLGGDSFATNLSVDNGLAELQAAALQAQTNVYKQLNAVDRLVDDLGGFQREEQSWLENRGASCQDLSGTLTPLMTDISMQREQLRNYGLASADSLINLNACYDALEASSANASAAALLARVDRLQTDLTSRGATSDLLREAHTRLEVSVSHAASLIQSSRRGRALIMPVLDRDLLKGFAGKPAFEARWELYAEVCALDATPISVELTDIGRKWARLAGWMESVTKTQTQLQQYAGPLAEQVRGTCNRLLVAASERKRQETVEQYLRVGRARMADLTNGIANVDGLRRAQQCLQGFENDLDSGLTGSMLGAQARELADLRLEVSRAKRSVIAATEQLLHE